MAGKSNKSDHGEQKPWRVDGISVEAVATATQAAQRAGVPLADWLSRLVRETAERERQDREQRRVD